MDPNFECFKGKSDLVRNRSFNHYLKEIKKIKKSDISDIEKVELIAGLERKMIRSLYKFADLEKCDEDQLTYLIKFYSDILEIMNDLKSDSPQFRIHYKSVENAKKKIQEERKEITVKSITNSLQSSRSSVMGFAGPSTSNHVLHFTPPPPPIKNKSNPFARGNEKEHKKFVEERKAEKVNSAHSPDVPPPPPPLPAIVSPAKRSRSRSRSRESSPNNRFLLGSRSVGNLLMTVKRVPKLSSSQSRRKRGGKTRKHKKN